MHAVDRTRVTTTMLLNQSNSWSAQPIERTWKRMISGAYHAVVAFILLAATAPISSDLLASQNDRQQSIEINHTWLRDVAFQIRPQQILLNAAQQKLEAGNYSDAFEALHELLKQPIDSAIVPNSGDSVRGMHSTIVSLLESLPPAAIAQWDATCKGPATRDLRRAVQKGSQAILEDVIRTYPYCEVAADAHLLRAAWLAGRGDNHGVRQSLSTLNRWRQKGILSQHQRTAVRSVQNAFQHADAPTNDQTARYSPQVQGLDEQPTWVWKMSSWDTPGGPNELPPRTAQGLGSQFTHQPGAQPPVLLKDAVIIRSPAGIARVDRESGRQQWFLPFETVMRDERNDESELERLFDFMPVEQDRLECDDETIYFLDGGAAGPVPPQGRFQPIRPPEVEATRVVAIRNNANPAVLWSSSSLTDSTNRYQAKGTGNTGPKYTFDISGAVEMPSKVISPTHESQRISVHRFHGAPVVEEGRVFVASKLDDLAYLNCLSASNGDLHWQQPLVWLRNADGDAAPDKAVVGGVINDVVVCLLASGAIIGCRVSDGTIEWMQSVLIDPEADEGTGVFALSSQADPGFVPAGGVGTSFGSLWLQIVDQRLVCGRRGSQTVFCVNGLNGHVEWTALGVASDGIVAGQLDLGCVGIVNGNVILAGYSHCRALKIDDGTQSWNLPTGDHSGRIAVSGTHLCIGLNSNRLLIVDGRSGEIEQSEYLRPDQMGHAWAIDEKGLASASAWRVESYSWKSRPSKLARPEKEPSSRLIGRPLKVRDDLLSPGPPSESQTLLTEAEALLAEDKREHAELLLLSMTPAADDPDTARQREELLTLIRKPILAPGREYVSPAQNPKNVTFTESSSHIASFRLKEIHERRRRGRGNRFRSSLPYWFRHPLMVDMTAANPQVGLIEVERGIEFSSTKLESLQFPMNQSRQESWDNPGLILIQRDNFVGVSSIFRNDPFAPLWLRQRPANRQGEVLSLSSRRLLIADNQGMTALHPLTGKTLWKRTWSDDDQTFHLHGQYFKVYDAGSHIVLMSSIGTAYIVVDGQDGTILREAKYAIGKIARVVGNHLLVVDNEKNLTATNLITGDQRRLSVSNVTDVTHAERVRKNLALITSEPGTITLVDLTSDDTFSHVDTAPKRPNLRGPWMPPQILRRSGLLFVAVSMRDWRARLPKTAFKEPQTGAGSLVCLDPESGRQLWQKRCETIVVPPVYGDPCPFVVTWSIKGNSGRRRGGINSFTRPDSIKLTILDAFTGKVVGQTYRRAIGIPLRVTHDSTERQLNFTFADAVIHMNYAE